MSRLLAFLKRLLPFVADEAVKVAPHIQAQIDAILKGAKLEVERLSAGNTVASIKAKLDADLTAVKEFAERQAALLREDADKRITAAAALLPPVESQFPTPPPAPPPA